MTKQTVICLISGWALAGTALSGCAEKKRRIWIDPPAGYEVSQRPARKLYYQVEDMQSGRKENLVIPVEQMPETIVVEDRKVADKGEGELALATKADRMIGGGKETPKLSYLRGLDEVESLYKQAKFTEALVRLAPLIEEYPLQGRLHVMQGTLLRQIGEKKLALRAYQEARKLDQNDQYLEEAIMRLQDELGGT